MSVSAELSVKLSSGDDMLGVLDNSESWLSRWLNRSCVSVVVVDGQEATWRWLDQSGIEALGSQNSRTEQTQRWAQLP